MRKFVRNDFRPGGYQQRPRRPENERPNTSDPMALSIWFMNTFSGNKVVRRDNESTDSMIRRFKKLVEQSGITKELKRREFYQTPSQKKREKKKKALKRLRKNQRINSLGDFDPKMLSRTDDVRPSRDNSFRGQSNGPRNPYEDNHGKRRDFAG